MSQAGAGARIPWPILIISFNRPDYLRRLCASLRAQQGVVLDETNIHLMQDGCRSPRSGLSYATEEEIAASLAVFREAFPAGQVHASPDNLGIAMNMLRAERHAFVTLKAHGGYFFEDDLELGPCYLAVMEAMRLKFRAHPKVGYFAAYGDHRRGGDPAAPRLVPMEHHWGFGLKRICWQAMQPWLKPFHQVYAEVDYQARPHLRIVEIFEAKQVSSTSSSQDVAKTMACAELGFARVNTDVSYARYIGEHGQSFRPATFERLGFHEMRYVERMPDSPPDVTEEIVAAIAERKRAACVAHRQERYAEELAEMRTRLFNPDRPATREEVAWLWRLLMDRVPGDDVLERLAGKRTLRQVRRQLLRNREAQAKGGFLA
jgi:hypothetical protein